MLMVCPSLSWAAPVAGEYQVKAGNVPAYTRVDLRLGWRPTDRLEFSLMGQNLFDPRHQEAGPAFFRAPTEVPRSVFLNATFGL